jgi:hypothetical protein
VLEPDLGEALNQSLDALGAVLDVVESGTIEGQQVHVARAFGQEGGHTGGIGAAGIEDREGFLHGVNPGAGGG